MIKYTPKGALPLIDGFDRKSIRLIEELYLTGKYEILRADGIVIPAHIDSATWVNFIPCSDEDVNGFDFDYTYRLVKID